MIHAGRDDLNQYKAVFAHETDKRTLDDALDGADVFVGLSGANLLSPEGLKRMAANPVVFACSNPDPEISPELAHATRSDVIMATGRSDYPNRSTTSSASRSSSAVRWTFVPSASTKR